MVFRLGDIRIYSKVLDSDERNDIYNNNLGLSSNAAIHEVGDGTERKLGREIGDAGGLALWYKLDGDADDYSPQQNNGTWSGTEGYVIGNHFDLASTLGSADDIIAGSSLGAIESISFWHKQTTSITNTDLIDLSATAKISISSGSITTTGLTGVTIYVNDVITSSLTADVYEHIVVLFDSHTADAFAIDPSTTIRIGDVRAYSSTLATYEIESLYNSGTGNRYNSYNLLTDGTIGENYILPSENYWRNTNPDNEFPNLEALYSFESEDATDLTSNGNDGTATDITYPTGKVGSFSALFNGSSSKIVSTPTITGYPFTFMCWFLTNTTSAATDRYIMSLVDADDTGISYNIYFRNSKIYMSADDGTTNSTQAGTSTVGVGIFIHLAVVFRSATDRRLYINGNLEIYRGEDNVTFNSAADTFAIGHPGGAFDINILDGQVDDVVVVSRALEREEIQVRYNGGDGKGNVYSSWDDIV